jgi:hypothetical protein
MQTINFDLSQLLKKIGMGHFLIPQFQRDFTWKEGQTRLLIDSIARNYPIGSLLILGKNDQVPLKSRRLDADYPPKFDHKETQEEFDEPSSESYYVLDGQQRLTSIARVFLDAHPSRNYYFDLKKMHEVFDSESPSWIVSRMRGKKNPERKDNNRLMRTDIALDQSKCDVYISEYFEDSGDFPEFKNDKKGSRLASAKIKGVFETIRKYSIPLVALDSDAPLESVCRVFETINSTGTRLTTFDLAVARYYPEPDLKEFFDNSIDKHPILKEYEIDGERILQILSLYELRENNKFPEATRSVLLSLKPDYIKSNWEKAVHHLSEAIKWIRELGATAKTQPPHGTLVSIAAALMCYPNALSESEFSTVLRKWYFCTTLAANPSPANNYKIGDDFRQFCDLLENRKQLSYPRVFFNPNELIEIKHITDSRYKAIQALMRTTVREDLITGNALNDNLEDHHIFPYSLKNSGINKNRLNSIVNRIIISQESNRNISNLNPDKYLFDLTTFHHKEGSVGDLERRLENCFIPYDPKNPDLFRQRLAKENFDIFLNDRALKIIERIQEVVGDAWKTPSELEDTNLEDDEFVST